MVGRLIMGSSLKAPHLTHENQTVTVEQVTPELAREYLATTATNRRIRPAIVQSLTNAIQNGDWHSMIEPIHFDSAGRLRNGQHRLTAIADSGRTVTVMVIRGATEDTIDSIDTGSRRTPGDLLKFRYDLADADTTAIVLKYLWQMKGIDGPPHPRSSGGSDARFNNHVLGEYFLEHPGVESAVAYINAEPSLRKLGSKAIMAFCYYHILTNGGERANDYFRCLDKEIFDGKGDPARHLVDRLRRAKSTGHSGNKKDRLNVTEVAALTIKAWNLWVAGRSTGSLRWKLYGEKPEKFPFPSRVR